MNLKQLYIFGMENSQEPVIKNPILRAALEGPGPMAQEPRNMKLAKYIPRHERDNFNTPDLEQSPDSYNLEKQESLVFQLQKNLD